VQFFLPPLYTSVFEEAGIVQLVSQTIYQWDYTQRTVYMTCAESLPWMTIRVNAFLEIRKEHVMGFQYNRTPGVVKSSPSLAMMRIDYTEEMNYNAYINEIIDNYLEAFEEACFMEDENDFRRLLFRLTSHYAPRRRDEVSLLHAPLTIH
jgi:hypothetical protein